MNMGKYDDILHLPHFEPKNHVSMSLRSRAAQFMPFASLRGFDDTISETARLTAEKPELDETEKVEIDRTLRLIRQNLAARPRVLITRFVPDERKQGGSIVTLCGEAVKTDEYARILTLSGGEQVEFEEILGAELLDTPS